MKNLIAFESAPNYVFGSDEADTVLVWPDSVPGMDVCFRSRESSESGETFDFRVYGYEIPSTGEEYEEIMLEADSSAVEHIGPGGKEDAEGA